MPKEPPTSLQTHAHLVVAQAEMKRRDILHHVRRLGALVDRQPRLGDVPVGDHRARLQRHAGVTPEHEVRFHHLVGIGERLVDSAGIEMALEGEIVAERGMNDRGFRIERGAHVRHRFQFLIVDRNQFGGVLGNRAAGRHDRGDRLALPADMIDRDRALRRRFEPLHVREHADPRRDDGGEFLPGHDSDHALDAFGRRGVDAGDFGVRIGRAQIHDMGHARQLDVADIEPPPLHQAIEVRPRHRLADIGVRPVQHRKAVRIFGGRGHGMRSDVALPARACAARSTASTMA